MSNNVSYPENISVRSIEIRGKYQNPNLANTTTASHRLCFYEEDTFPLTLMGGFASNQTMTVHAQRIGPNVTLSFPQVLAPYNSSANYITSTTNIPAKYLPPSFVEKVIPVVNDQTSNTITNGTVTTDGIASISTTGVLYIAPGPAGTNFSVATNNGYNGFPAFQLSYYVGNSSSTSSAPYVNPIAL